jgi:NAD(P)-dependent dehydrogenase (short-subunit alcohol dehydrogenase family)
VDLKLKGKSALVSGATSGIGAAIAVALAKEGVRVAIQGRDAARATRVIARIVKSGGYAISVLGDLSVDVDAQAIVQTTLEKLGAIDILVNTAGVYERRPWMQPCPEDWAATYNVNVLSAVRLIRGVVPHMKSSGWGRIIQLSSRVATRPPPDMPDYAASKAALINLTVSLAKEVAHWGITVNTVSAGIVLTRDVERSLRSLAEERSWSYGGLDCERKIMEEWGYDSAVRFARPEDVANLVAFLSSPLAGCISGSNLRVDGGGTGTVN